MEQSALCPTRCIQCSLDVLLMFCFVFLITGPLCSQRGITKSMFLLACNFLCELYTVSTISVLNSLGDCQPLDLAFLCLYYFYHSVMCVISIIMFLTAVRNTVWFHFLLSKLLLLLCNIPFGIWYLYRDSWLCSFSSSDVCLNLIQVLYICRLFSIPVQ